MQKTRTFIFGPKPSHADNVENKWVFRKKLKVDGSSDKYNARLLAQGFLQKEVVDYDEVFAPVVRNNSLRIILGIAIDLVM